MSNNISLGQRRTGYRPTAKRMVIVVEGRSEKVYFERFRTPERPLAIRIHESKDRNAEGMIKKCTNLIERSGLDTEFDEVIAVFDADRNEIDDLKAAEEAASKKGIKIYISNPSFEFWLLLHFEENRVTYIQKDIEELLGKHIQTKYKKSEGINNYIDEEDIKKAIVRSKKILPSGNPIACKNNLPSTCLHLLVERISRDHR